MKRYEKGHIDGDKNEELPQVQNWGDTAGCPEVWRGVLPTGSKNMAAFPVGGNDVHGSCAGASCRLHLQPVLAPCHM